MARKRKSIKVDTRELSAYARRVKVREKNFRPVWQDVFDDLADAHMRNFQTDGAAVGGWAPVTGRYFNEKFKQGYGGRTMIRTGSLRDALSSFRGAGSERAQRLTSASWGIDTSDASPISYAKFHQTGTRNLHERQIVFTPRGFGKRVAEMIGEHIVVDKGPSGARTRGRGVFDL